MKTFIKIFLIFFMILLPGTILAEDPVAYIINHMVYKIYDKNKVEIGYHYVQMWEEDYEANKDPELNIPSTVTLEGQELPITRIATMGFVYDINYTKVIMPNSVMTIGYSAFTDCINLKEVIFSENINSIDRRAFENCKSLKKVVLPESLHFLEELAFRRCESLQTVAIPHDIEKMGQQVFINCDKLSTVINNQTEPFPIYDNVFSDYTHKHARLIVPKGCADKYRNTKGWDIFENIEEATTGIDAISTDKSADSNSSAAYNLEGQKVSDGYKGIVIKNGKKILIR